METRTRKIEAVIEPWSALEGAGVRVRRSIGTRTLNYLDPFLLLDHFGGANPEDYEAGFPLHPHRGIITVTYVMQGTVHHKDTLGNEGSIGKGDVQWMTSGRGILHEEMPQVRPEGNDGFQLWVNLPASRKMMPPNYQDIRSAEIPVIQSAEGAEIRIVAGEYEGGHHGPVRGIPDVEPEYLDVTVPPYSVFHHAISSSHNAFSYVFQGEGMFGPDGTVIRGPQLLVWGDGDSVQVRTGDSAVRFLLVSGKPLHEPVARYGPFVMNTREEIEQTLEELRKGTFISETVIKR